MSDQRTMALRPRERAASEVNTIHEQPDAQHQQQIKPFRSTLFCKHIDVTSIALNLGQRIGDLIDHSVLNQKPGHLPDM